VNKQIATHLKKSDEQMQLLKLIYEIREDHPTIGMRDLYYLIQPESLGRDAFESFCKKNNLWSKKPVNYRRTTDSTGVIRFDDLVTNTSINRTNQVWQSDITYYQVNNKFYYLTFVVDSFSRRIVGHCTSEKLHTVHTTIPALQNAIRLRKNENLSGLIFHSDGGGQYYAKEFLQLTNKMGFRNSMCEYAWENGKAERINGVIKNNYLTHRSIKTYSDLIKEVDRAVVLYNSQKPHIKLQRKSPINFEAEVLLLQKQTRPMMKESLVATTQISGASSPGKSEQTRPQNQDVLIANYELQ
jgi:transposase InsO family protein